MSTTNNWQPRTLFVIFVGKKDRNNQNLTREEIERSMGRLLMNILTDMGGYTKVKFIEAEGETGSWGKEDTQLVLVLTDQEKIAEANFPAWKQTLLKALDQDEIWATKQRLELLATKRV